MRSIRTRTFVGLAATAILGGTSVAIPLAVSADGADSAHHTSVGGVDDHGHHRTADDQAAVRHFRHHEAGDDRSRDRAGHHEAGDDRDHDGAGHHERGDDHGRHSSRHG